MATTYELIKGETLSSAQASYTFSAIPSTYTDLVLKASVRSTYSGGNDLFIINFNSDTPVSGTKYSQTYINTPSGSVSSGGNSNGSVWYSVKIPSAASTSNTYSITEIYIPSYQASQSKPMSINDVWENNDATTADISAHATLWNDTTAISSMTITPYLTASLASGSSFYLYGIKNS